MSTDKFSNRNAYALRDKLKEIHKIVSRNPDEIMELDWESPDCKSQMFSIIRALEHKIAKIKELSE